MKIEDRIGYTKQGYDYIKVSPIENLMWGGQCICNGCNEQFLTERMYLVFVLGDTYCEKCFKEWEKSVKIYTEDLEFQKNRSLEWYKLHLDKKDRNNI